MARLTAGTSIGSGGTGSYPWPINPTGATGNDYKVKVQSISQPAIKDTSNNYFTIIPAPTTPSVTVVYPNDPSSFSQGNQITIKWQYSGSPGSAVKIELLKGSLVSDTITESTPVGSAGQGTYVWTIPLNQPASHEYRVEDHEYNKPCI